MKIVIIIIIVVIFLTILGILMLNRTKYLTGGNSERYLEFKKYINRVRPDLYITDKEYKTGGYRCTLVYLKIQREYIEEVDDKTPEPNFIENDYSGEPNMYLLKLINTETMLDMSDIRFNCEFIDSPYLTSYDVDLVKPWILTKIYTPLLDHSPDHFINLVYSVTSIILHLHSFQTVFLDWKLDNVMMDTEIGIFGIHKIKLIDLDFYSVNEIGRPIDKYTKLFIPETHLVGTDAETHCLYIYEFNKALQFIYKYITRTTRYFIHEFTLYDDENKTSTIMKYNYSEAWYTYKHIIISLIHDNPQYTIFRENINILIDNINRYRIHRYNYIYSMEGDIPTWVKPTTIKEVCNPLINYSKF